MAEISPQYHDSPVYKVIARNLLNYPHIDVIFHWGTIYSIRDNKDSFVIIHEKK